MVEGMPSFDASMYQRSLLLHGMLCISWQSSISKCGAFTFFMEAELARVGLLGSARDTSGRGSTAGGSAGYFLCSMLFLSEDSEHFVFLMGCRRMVLSCKVPRAFDGPILLPMDNGFRIYMLWF